MTGGLAVWEFPKRIVDTIAMLGVSLGLGFLIIIWYFIKTEARRRDALLWMIIVPIIWFATNLAAETYVYMVITIGFGAIVVGLGLSKMRAVWSFATALIAIGLLVFNAYYFDIGRTLDPEMSAMKFYNEELPKIPDGQYFMGGAWNWAMVYLYNKEEGRNIIPISTDSLPSENYLNILEGKGIKFERNNLADLDDLDKQETLMLSITRLNEGVWIAKESKPEVYQYIIEPARGNEAYIGRWLGYPVIASWQWQPTNPYKYITGAVEVAEWNRVLLSNWNIRFFASLFASGWLMMGMIEKLRKKREIMEKVVGIE